MLDDYSIYIDPEEDEVFFTALLEKPVITISKPNNSLADLSVEEDTNAFEENVKSSVKSELCSGEPLCEESKIIELKAPSNEGTDICKNKESCVPIVVSESCSKEPLCERQVVELEASWSNLSDICENKENCVPIVATGSCSGESLCKEEKAVELEVSRSDLSDIFENKENFVPIIGIDQHIKNDGNIKNPDQLKIHHNLNQNNSIDKLTLANDEKQLPNIVLKENNFIEGSEFKTPLKRTPLKLRNGKSSSKENKTSGRKAKRFSNAGDISLSEFELSGDINESLISWSSVDVNVQLENLMADLDFEDVDNDAYENELHQLSSTPLKCDDEQLKFSWTPNGLNVCLGTHENHKSKADEIAYKVPSINIIEASPAVAPPPSPNSALFNRPDAPIRFRPIYSSGQKVVATNSSSGSSLSYTTPARTPLSKTKGIISNIPKPSVKKVAAKSLQFSHIESPISKYIYDKSTPLVSNVKGTKITTQIPGPSPCLPKTTAKTQSATKQLPHARYQKGIPLRQEKATESRLPRLGCNQMRVVAAVPNARVISHTARQTDVSVLVSSPAKINPK